jgi:hypothetical protein
MIVVDYALEIRQARERDCFPIVNRGFLWYNRLTTEQLNELDDWYQAWLDAPETRVIPPKPLWVDSKIDRKDEEILL